VRAPKADVSPPAIPLRPRSPPSVDVVDDLGGAVTLELLEVVVKAAELSDADELADEADDADDEEESVAEEEDSAALLLVEDEDEAAAAAAELLEFEAPGVPSGGFWPSSSSVPLVPLGFPPPTVQKKNKA